MTIVPLGDRALLLTPDDATRIAPIAAAIRTAEPPGIADVVPAFNRIAIHCDDRLTRQGRMALAATLQSIAANAITKPTDEARTIELPTRYDGPDLRDLAASLKLTPDELIARHASATYAVLAVGFTPGFAYLGGLPPELHAPRRPTPRPRVEPGSVAIGGPYTGVYPSPTPGGWHLIGTTDAALFDLSRDPPSRLRVDDRVRFIPLFPVPGGEGRGEGVDARSSPVTIERAEQPPTPQSAPSQTPPSQSLPPHPSPLPRVRGRGSITFASPGTHTTIQDLGRPGHRAAGVPIGGAADRLAHSVANWLVGYDANAATLECALVGPRLRFARDAVVAICGARVAGLPYARPFRVARGDELNLERLDRGTYAYLAIAGGIDAPTVLGSRSTDARLGIGRPLRAGDAITIANPSKPITPRGGWRAAVDDWYDAGAPIRYLRGGDAINLAASSFAATARSNRMGLRLAATPRLAPPSDPTRASVPVTVGTIQVPPDGDAIVLLADAQTIGGYAVAGHVVSVDLPRLAQRRPGDAVRFVEVSLDEADAARNRLDRELGRLRCGLDFVARASRP